MFLNLIVGIALALVRTLTSSTFLSGVASVAASAVLQSHGVDVPAAAIAAVPLAVGVKEGARRIAERATSSPVCFQAVASPSSSTPGPAACPGVDEPEDDDGLASTKVRRIVGQVREQRRVEGV